MKGLPEERAITLAQYIIDHGSTVRQTAKAFNISKSTVHTVVTKGIEADNKKGSFKRALSLQGGCRPGKGAVLIAQGKKAV